MGEKFADPDVKDEVIDRLQDVASNKEPVYPWNILEQMENEEFDKQEARKALRKLRMNNNIVPADGFKGKVELAERLET